MSNDNAIAKAIQSTIFVFVVHRVRSGNNRDNKKIRTTSVAVTA